MTDPASLDAVTTRRQFLVRSAGVGALLVGGRVLDLEEALAATADWRYTDDRGQRIRRSTRPKRIVAYSDAAAALYNFGIVPVGVFGTTPRKEPSLKNLPWRRVTEVGTVYGEIQLEKLAALKPDLIVSTWYPPPLDAVPFGFKDKEHLATIGRIAPVAAVNAHVVITRGLKKFRRLGSALGANMRAPKLLKAEADFERASARVKAAAARKRNIRVLALSPSFGNLYIAQPRDHADLWYWRSLGVNIVVPAVKDAYWEVAGFENVGKYPADVVLYDSRSFALSRADLMKIPTFAALPAVRAGQLAAWQATPPIDYATYAKNMVSLAGTIRNARKIV